MEPTLDSQHRPIRPRSVRRMRIIVVLVVLILIALFAGLYWRCGSGGATLGATSNATSASSAGGQLPPAALPAIVDSSAPIRPYVQGTFQYEGPGGAFTENFGGSMSFSGSCADYAKSGFGGQFATPYGLYTPGTKLDRSMTGGVSVREYRGPGIYKRNDLTGDMGSRGPAGDSLGFVSSNSPSEFEFTTRPDGSGMVTFSGKDLQNLKVREEITGSMTWTCQDSRLKLDAYSLNAY